MVNIPNLMMKERLITLLLFLTKFYPEHPETFCVIDLLSAGRTMMERANISRPILLAIEKSSPTASSGSYINVLFVFG